MFGLRSYVEAGALMGYAAASRRCPSAVVFRIVPCTSQRLVERSPISVDSTTIPSDEVEPVTPTERPPRPVISVGAIP